jgi:hypothetical protein
MRLLDQIQEKQAKPVTVKTEGPVGPSGSGKTAK